MGICTGEAFSLVIILMSYGLSRRYAAKDASFLSLLWMIYFTVIQQTPRTSNIPKDRALKVFLSLIHKSEQRLMLYAMDPYCIAIVSYEVAVSHKCLNMAEYKSVIFIF